MKKGALITITTNIFALGFMVSQVQLALAAPTLSLPPDLPPGAMNFDSPTLWGLPVDPNIAAAIIGVIGLIVGSVIIIVATLVMRRLDIKREDQREDMMLSRYKKEKEYQIKQEIYKNLLNELAEIETFSSSDLQTFKRDWTRTEVKVDLIASKRVREAKEILQKELFDMAEKNIKGKSSVLTPAYLKCRENLLDAIREDIDIFQSNSNEKA